MTHIHETITERHEQSTVVQMNLGGLQLRDTITPSHKRFHIPNGVAVEIPNTSPLATLQFTDGSLDMGELKQLLEVAKGFHLPADLPVVLSFHDGNVSASTTDPVVRQILEYYAETHQQGLTIHHDFENPSVFRDDIAFTSPEVLIPPLTIPVQLIEPEVDA